MSKRAVNKPPPHPGEVLRNDVIPDLGITIAQFAADLGVSNQTMSLICRERGGITASTALRLGAYLSCDPQLWTTMQAKFNLWRAEQDICTELERIKKRGERRPPKRG